MCGIFSMAMKEGLAVSRREVALSIDRLLRAVQVRGKESTGVGFFFADEISWLKRPERASVFLRSRAYRAVLNHVMDEVFEGNGRVLNRSLVVVGVARLATNGSEFLDSNNQPVVLDKLLGVHNGIVTNDRKLVREESLTGAKGETDAEVLFLLLQKLLRAGLSPENALRRVFAKIEGSATVSCFEPEEKKLLLATNTGSLYQCSDPSGGFYLYASERPILKEAIEASWLARHSTSGIEQVEPGRAHLIDCRDFKRVDFSLGIDFPGALQAIYEKKGDYFRDLIASVREDQKNREVIELNRCTKCILPDTYPLIEFDSEGVCNYCREYQPIETKGEAALEKIADAHRREDGSPDCIVAFSGGRDSAYALHYVKRVLGLNPIAFTYDWGMVADIARRNQARLVGKLGVEHVIVASDIKAKRRNIRRYVEAWLKKPHLGAVVMFMSGDKPAEYWVTKIARRHGIKLVFLCRGNEIENSDFKWGYLNLKRGEPGGVLHHLGFSDTLVFTVNLMKRYFENPAHFNPSLLEMLFNYASTYVFKYDFEYFWHYLKWDEEEVVRTLRTEYDWEVPGDTIQTWRVDDGTSPFYNFIYHKMGGFTENDCLRSNQVREGLISRDQALQLATLENKYRYDAIRNYLARIGLDYDRVMRAIEGFPRRYSTGNASTGSN